METLKHWFMTHFIVIAEVIGYVISLSVILGAVATVFISLDVTTSLNGALAPQATQVTAEEDCAVVQYNVDSGETVKLGDTLCHIVVGEEQIRQARAARKLQEGLELLGQEGQALAQTPAQLAVPDGTPVHAPTPGLFVAAPSGLRGDLIPERSPVAAIYNPSVLVMRGILSTKEAESIRPGMPATVTHPAASEVLEGEVAAIETVEDGTAIELLFTDLDEKVEQAFADSLKADDPSAAIELRAKIVSGRQSLFSRLFGRNR